jgi:hypothetical protein
MIIFVDIVPGVLRMESRDLERATGVWGTGNERFSLLAKFVPTPSNSLP